MSYIKLWTEILLSIVKTFISKWVPMNFHGNEKKLRKGSHDLWNGTEKLFTTRSEILGLE